jgi:uncharacterized protein
LSDIPPKSQEPLRDKPERHAGRGSRPRRSALRGCLVRVVRLAILICVGFLAVVYIFQGRLIFQGATTQGQPEAQVRPRAGAELVQLKTKTGERVVALFGPALSAGSKPDPAAASRPTMIFFYGNAMCLNDAASEFDRFRRLGLNVLIPEYVGYGMSGGKASEQGCQATADAAYDYLVSTRKVDANRIISAGWSLGGAVAIDLAARRTVGGLIAFSTFTSTNDMARTFVPLTLPRWFLVYRFDSLSKIPTIACPILLGHGRRDPLVPFAMFERLARAAKSPTATLVIEQAGHNDFFNVGGPRIDDAIGGFFKERFGQSTMLDLFQTRMIFPGASTQGQSFADVQARPGTELVTLKTQRGERVVALFGGAMTFDGRPDPAAASRPTMIYFYGNAMCLNDAASEFDRFRHLGLNVLVPDYVGYGMSGGKASEQGCEATAEATYDYLVSTQKVDPKRIIAAGWSLGGAVAIDLASRRQIGGLVAFSTFTSGIEMARRMLPFVPVSLLLRHRFDNRQKIAKVRCPVLIGHGGRDPVVPFAMGKKLAACAEGPVTTLWIDQAEHNDFFDVGGRRIDEAIGGFVKEHLPAKP